jgi:hypothetical protein
MWSSNPYFHPFSAIIFAASFLLGFYCMRYATQTRAPVMCIVLREPVSLKMTNSLLNKVEWAHYSSQIYERLSSILLLEAA